MCAINDSLLKKFDNSCYYNKEDFCINLCNKKIYLDTTFLSVNTIHILYILLIYAE